MTIRETREGSSVTTWNDIPAGAGGAERPAPAGDQHDEHAAQRAAWGRVQASYRRGNTSARHRRRAARGTLRAGMIRRPPPPGDDAA